MNKQKIIELLKDGAFLKVETSQFFHPSFLKGFRKVSAFDVSWRAAIRELEGSIKMVDGCYMFSA